MPVTLACALMLSGCVPTIGASPVASSSPSKPVSHPPPSDSSPGTAPSRDPRLIATNLEAPWSVVFLSDGTPLVSERDSARILEVTPAGTVREVGTIPSVRTGGEGGLLGLAIGSDERLYVYSTGPRGNRVQRIALRGEPGLRSLSEAETLLDGIPSASTHNGGRIAFGPDGLLYVTVGDAGDRLAAQDVQSLAGKILRMTADGEVPTDNPFPGSLVYSFGHRNPQGIAWAPNGTMLASEFGQDRWDELNIIEPGANYGWPHVEGIAGDARFVDPIQQWAPADASPSGIAILDDTIHIANLRGQRLRMVPLAEPSMATEAYVGTYGRLRDVAAAPDGQLWLLTNNRDGRGSPRPGDDRIVAVTPP